MKKKYYQLVFNKKTKEVSQIKAGEEVSEKVFFVYDTYYDAAHADFFEEFITAQVYFIKQIKPSFKPTLDFFVEQLEHITLILNTYKDRVK